MNFIPVWYEIYNVCVWLHVGDRDWCSNATKMIDRSIIIIIIDRKAFEQNTQYHF